MKLSWRIPQNSHEKTCQGDNFLVKLQTRPTTLLQKNYPSQLFPVGFSKHFTNILITKVLRKNLF